MASISKQIKKSSKLRKTVITSALALSLLAPVMVPQVNANGNEDLGYVDPTANTNPGNSGADTVTYRVQADPATGQPEIEAAKKGVLKIDGKQFRDLDGDRGLDTLEITC
jgi:beta-glucosidase